MSSSSRSAPLVSVVITTYYRNDEVERAIRSCLEQTYEPLEVIVVDDSGEGFARDVVDQYDDVRYVRMDSNRGHVVARNTGVRAANGDVIQFLDDDDVLLPTKLEKQVSLLSDDVGVVFCGVRREGNPTLPGSDGRGDVLEKALANDFPCCITSSMLVDGAIVEDVMPFPDMPGASDTMMRIEFARRTGFEFVPEVLVEKGDSDGSVGSTMGKCEGYRLVLERYRDLYEKCPPVVERSMRSSMYSKRGEVLIADRNWSLSAIASFGLAALYGRDPKKASLFLLSYLGKPGIHLGGRVFMKLHPNRTSDLPTWARF